MKITLGEAENQKVVETKYNIGDIVIVRDSIRSSIPEKTKYRPKWRGNEEFDRLNMPGYPVEVETRYTISDIKVSAASGSYLYELFYSNPRVIFPSANRGATEDEIIEKVDTNDYETVEDVLHFMEYNPGIYFPKEPLV